MSRLHRHQRALHHRLAGDEGLSLVELLVAMILTAVVMTLVTGAVIQASRFVTHDEDEQQGLQDAKVIMDRLGRDVRESRSVVCDGGRSDPTDATSPSDPNCKSHLQLWVDYNSDYIKQDDEVITWYLSKSATSEHYDVWRITGTGATPVTKKREATSLYTNFAFSYTVSPGSPAASGSDMSHVTQVDIGIQYDAIIGRGTSLRDASFSARLRNKGA